METAIGNDIRQGRLVLILLDIGEAMVNCGAEIFRVEDTLNRIGYAYGAEEMNVFVITSSIVITAKFSDDQIITHTKRIRSSETTDFTMLEAVNELSREVCSHPISLNHLQSRVESITSISNPPLLLLAGYTAASASFTIFFGGTMADSAASALIGILIWLFEKYLKPFCMNNMVYQFTASFLSSTAICLICALFHNLTMDQIMIGDIMLLIPGIMFTNAMRDVLLGDTISGTLRLIQALLLTLMLAFGIISAIFLFGRLV